MSHESMSSGQQFFGIYCMPEGPTELSINTSDCILHSMSSLNALAVSIDYTVIDL